MLFIKNFDNQRRKRALREKRQLYIQANKQLTNDERSFSPKCLMLFYDCYEKSLFSLSLFFSPSQTTDPLGYFRWGNADCLLLISVRCRHFNRERERDRFTIGNERKREKKKKYYRNGQSHHLSHVCMCRLTCESILSANIHTH
jgi:hypothetical protein